ncbi:MAG TPA: hypothetical protein VHZ29_09775 [Rhizomicrobium sp.]|nr:hypothetical protein [Rhizomicrobium sp.]
MTGSSFSLTPHAAANAAVAPAPAAKHDFSFHDFLDIINPLQHLPVVGTIYRAITGDEIKTPEKIAGDTIYGGPLGALSAVADAIYQQSTGKSFGDTVLGWFTGHHGATAVARNPNPAAPAKTQAASADAAPHTAVTPDIAALTASLNRNGADTEIAQRALYAYRRSFATAAPSAFVTY